jgi:alkanesulfonate monooxygenase SsuD/methylene tetrahydromethanopterin reductase-like flavin-dependent oxidoreductase (luciferase family)
MPKPITFGLINTFGNPREWKQPWHGRYQAILEQTEWIDKELTIDGVYVTEHHFYDDGYLPSPMVMTAAIAARTSRITIGTNVLQLPLHNPVRVAEEALVIDAISGGRLRLGVGAGYYWQEFEGLGQSLKQRGSRMDESLVILRRAFAGEPFEFHGKHFDFSEIFVTPEPIRPGGPELWVGAFAPPAIQRAARLADGFFEFLPETGAQYVQMSRALGNPEEEIRVNATYWAIIAEDPERAFALAGDHWLHLLNQYIMRDAYAGLNPPLVAPFETPAEALAAGLVTLADGPAAIEKFNADVDRGIVDINIVTMMPGEPIDQVSERLQYLNDKVIPKVKHSESAVLNPRLMVSS